MKFSCRSQSHNKALIFWYFTVLLKEKLYLDCSDFSVSNSFPNYTIIGLAYTLTNKYCINNTLLIRMDHYFWSEFHQNLWRTHVSGTIFPDTKNCSRHRKYYRQIIWRNLNGHAFVVFTLWKLLIYSAIFAESVLHLTKIKADRRCQCG